MVIYLPKCGLRRKYFECRRHFTEVPKWKLSVAINWNMTVMQIKIVCMWSFSGESIILNYFVTSLLNWVWTVLYETDNWSMLVQYPGEVRVLMMINILCMKEGSLKYPLQTNATCLSKYCNNIYAYIWYMYTSICRQTVKYQSRQFHQWCMHTKTMTHTKSMWWVITFREKAASLMKAPKEMRSTSKCNVLVQNLSSYFSAYLCLIVGPWAIFHQANLLVPWKIIHF